MVRSIGGRFDPLMLRLTRGRVSSVLPFPALLIHHIGARSGRQRTSTVVYFTDGGRVIVIASNFGSDRNPAWYHNVLANREVTLFGRGIDGRFIAQVVVGAERDRLFRLAKAGGPYGEYEATAGQRTIPVVAFSPVNGLTG
jgi:deazaflavin-dependent oxidoreductase (nitroreductase family)